MPRTPKPWYRKWNDAWYVQLDGRQVLLANGRKNKAAALKRFHELMSTSATIGETATVIEVLDAYLADAEGRLTSRAFAQYRNYLQSFTDLYRDRAVESLVPRDANAWLAGFPKWGESTRAYARAVLVAALNWAEINRLIPRNSLRGPRPDTVRSRGRASVISEETHARLLACASPAVRVALTTLRQTGCRPSEMRRVTADHFFEARGVWVFSEHKTRKRTQRDRVVVLCPDITALCRELARRHPTGPLFRDDRDRPCTAATLLDAMRTLRRRSGARAYPYGYRHTFCSRLLEAGVPDAHVAVLAGHASTATVYKHYSHLTGEMAAVRAALERLPSVDAERGVDAAGAVPGPEGGRRKA